LPIKRNFLLSGKGLEVCNLQGMLQTEYQESKEKGFRMITEAEKLQLIVEMEIEGLLCTENCPYVVNEEEPDTLFVVHKKKCQWQRKARELLAMPHGHKG
jgi:hypothetical protein